ncbi:MAG TPA: bifunctional proline dehydrogenase/L-glutamate gamma-semialdehyde dehydrogenase PutA [Devosia sp.]|nr:bifunctional proline dehydrogenase/L-glutamate gamma-semialdehyde dehydrogenase PutA [Devosia sp.]
MASPVDATRQKRDALFSAFAGPVPLDTPLRQAIRAAIRRPETECVPPLIAAATLDAEAAVRVTALATELVRKLRAAGPSQGIAGMIHEYSLSSEEGVALMCLAEALLRIPDDATRDALIRDKVSRGDWRAHLGPERTLFVNAATWGLMVTGKITSAIPEEGLARALGRLIARGGEPIVRVGVDLAMRMMGETFVAGQTIGEALRNSRRLERRGFLYSYDMLGEAATTAEDAEHYLRAYEEAIDAIGAAAAGRGPIGGPGISIKLSALHPRYRRSQTERVRAELLPRLKALAARAKRYNIGLNIDAEEADRLDISLDLLEALCFEPELRGWDGIGFVVQAYGKRCSAVVDWLIDLAHRSGHRLMVRLVKGAYWDSEIKAAQVEGLSGYPVFTRKVYSDVSYLAAARKLLGARDAIFPQFATHNAQSVAAIYEMAGTSFQQGSYEFQCLHGMGEPLYNNVVGADGLNRPCRIYAPVGTHGTLLAYLVRRLLENGANSSFVNRISDVAVPVEALVADPAQVAGAIVPVGSPHPQIPLPRDILGGRVNSAGLDLADDTVLVQLTGELAAAGGEWSAGPVLANGPADGAVVTVRNPADPDDLVGTAAFAPPELVARTFAGATPGWAPLAERTRILRDAADRLQARLPRFLALMMREAGKTAGNGIAEVREAVDFLRYYADQAEALGPDAQPLGIVVCISPWNFPLSIFCGQVAAALAAGNAVIAKPAEETPLTAAAMVTILHEAGVPRAALQFLPGAGDVGAALCGHPQVAGVVFTGSTEVARLIQRQLAPRGAVPLIAETGGINAMIVDSSALTEQVVNDVLSSAFDSAGQRCSALRLLLVQDDVADRTLTMLKGAMQELRVGNPAELRTDVGPVITAEAAERISDHIEAKRKLKHRITQSPVADGRGTFVPPTLIELDRIEQLKQEVFGPVLHVVRYARQDLDRVIDEVNALGFGLTFGLHTRLDETIDRVTSRIHAGNIYVNRNIIGAVVGVQPFGGQGMSGTGPKAGGPLYLRRLVRQRPADNDIAELLPGPVGESNLYRTAPRGEILLLPQTREGLSLLLDAVAATRNAPVIDAELVGAAVVRELAPQARLAAALANETSVDGVLVEGGPERVASIARQVAEFAGRIIPVQSAADVNRDMLVHEISVSINTAAAGGNASLMALAER